MPGTRPDVTITFAGLLLFCLNQKSEFEAAVVPCPEHELLIDVQEITIDEDSGEEKRSRLKEHNLDLDKNIYIEVINSDSHKVELYQNNNIQFDRKLDSGDPKDSRWVIDLKSSEFNLKSSEFNPGEESNNAGSNGGDLVKVKGEHAKKLDPIITVTDGLVYTEKRSDVKFAVIPVNGQPRQPQLLGRIAFVVGLEISFKDTNGDALLLSNEGSKNQLELKKKPGIRYLITIENLCQITPGQGEGTDFRFIFDAVRNRRGDVFDLQRVVENGGRGNTDDTLPGHPDFSLDAEDQPCMGGMVSFDSSFSDLG